MENQTQPSTQPQWDSRRSGAFSSPEYDDVICILHPSSASAITATKLIWQSTPAHILQYQKPGLDAEGGHEDDGLEMEGLEPAGDSFQTPEEPKDLDIALRTTASLKKLTMGFVFGREPSKVDIQIATRGAGDARISGMHFRIYVTEVGVLMLEDTSTNGTFVDDLLLKGRSRMLSHGSMIEVITGAERATASVQKARFIVKLPRRKDGSRYESNLMAFLSKVDHALRTEREETRAIMRPNPAGRPKFDLLTAGTARYSWDMGWNDSGKYNPIGEVGKGAFATVFKVATADQGEIFAAKQINRSAFVKNGVTDTKFYNELNIMKKLAHPHIVTFHDSHLDTQHLYIVMEFVACGDMAPYTKRDNFLGEPILRSVMKQLLHALVYIHANGVVHRDIKPENLLVSSKDPFTVKLSDFGLSKMIDHDEQAALITFCGTMLYCAPEVYPDYEEMKFGGPRNRHARADPKPYSSSVDIWSLGVVLYYFIAAKPPYKGSAEDGGRKMLYAILNNYLDYEPIDNAPIQPCGRRFVTAMLATSSVVRESAQELLKYDWMQDVEDVFPIPALEGVDVLSDPRLETVEEQDEISSCWGPDDVDGNEESESFAKAAEGRLSDTASEVPGLVHDSTSTEGRIVELHDNVEVPETDHTNSLEDEKLSTIESLDGPGDIEETPLDQEAGRGIDTGSFGNSPENGSVVRPELFNTSRLHILPSRGVLSETSDHSRDSNAELSILEAYAGASDFLSDVSSNPPNSFTSPLMPDRPAPGRLFGEIPNQVRPVTESGIFGAHERPFIRQDSNSSLGTNRSSSASLSGAERKMDGLNVRTFNHPVKVPSKRHRLAEVMNTSDMDSGSSDGEPAAKKSMTLAAKSPSASIRSLSEEADYSQQVSQGLDALRLQIDPLGDPLGTLTPDSSGFKIEPLVLSSRLTTWGRDPKSTHVYEPPTDIRIAKNSMYIYFCCTEAIVEEASTTTNPNNGGPVHPPIIPTTTSSFTAVPSWRLLPNLHAMIMTRSRNGIKVNNVRLHMSPLEGPSFKVGKLKSGDVIEVYNNDKTGEYLRFRCEFNVGESKNARAEAEPFVVEENRRLYEGAVRENATRMAMGMGTATGAGTGTEGA